MKVSIVVPCYNEVENVAKLHDKLLLVVEQMVADKREFADGKVLSAELIFVDDGSRDGTFVKLQEMFGDLSISNIVSKIVKHETNLGLGAAIRTGFSQAEGDIVLTVDSDGTYKFSEIPTIIDRLAPDVDMVTASPYHPQGSVIGVPAYRLFLSRGSSFLYRILVDHKVYTYTCLFRAYRSEVIRNISFHSNDFLAGTEILVKAIFKGYRVVDFPAVLYRRVYGVSKARIAQTIFSHLKFQGWILLYRIQLLIGFKSKQIF